MHQWLKNWKPKDVIALVLLIGAFVMYGIGRDGLWSGLIMGIAVTYGVWTARDQVVSYKKSKKGNGSGEGDQ